jgi:hypothetical protein
LDSILEKTHFLALRVLDFERKKPIRGISIKIFRLEKEPITPKQWAENLKNGAPFKSLVLSSNTDDNGNVSAELPEGSYEAKIEIYGLSKVCELTQNDEILVIATKKPWWK